MSKKNEVTNVSTVIENQFFRTCLSQVEKMSVKIGKSQWEMADLIAKHLNSPSFKATFVNQNNYADAMGLKREYVTKARKNSEFGNAVVYVDCSEIKEGVEVKFKNIFTISQVQELTRLEVTDAVALVMEHDNLPEMSCKEIRELVNEFRLLSEDYKDKKLIETDNTSEDVPDNETESANGNTTEDCPEDEMLTIGLNEFYAKYGTTLSVNKRPVAVITLETLRDILADYVSITIQ